MQEIHLTAHFKIQPGKTQAFKEVATRCIAAVKAHEPGALRYDWYYLEDQSECKVQEIYRDTGAVMAHMQNVGPLLGELLSMSTVTGEVFGPITGELKEIFQGLQVTFYEYETGL